MTSKTLKNISIAIIILSVLGVAVSILYGNWIAIVSIAIACVSLVVMMQLFSSFLLYLSSLEETVRNLKENQSKLINLLSQAETKVNK